MTDEAEAQLLLAEREPEPAAPDGPVAEGPDPRSPRTGWTLDLATPFGRWGRRIADSKPQTWVTAVIVMVCVGFVFSSVHPELIFRDTTPTGGDMGSHVWGPNYLMHHLLPDFRLTGWSPDWYAGFPAFQFYMVLPALEVVALHVGVRSFLLLPALLITLGITVSGWFVPALERWRRLLFGIGAFLTVITVPIPYNIAFKLTTVTGLLLLPVACWAFGRLSGLPFPGPPILALASLFVIYNREPVNNGTGNIIGGNMASTMAGEFAFSIGLAVCVVYIGFLVNGLRTGKHRRTAAALLALTGLCHLIPAFFALTATFVALAVWPGRERLKWALPVLPVAGLLSAFWVVPFLLRHPYVNDMGWEKLPLKGATNPDGSLTTVWNYLIPKALWWPLALAAVGLVVSIVYRYRAGIMLAATTVIAGAAFVWIPQARLWNARVLPFFFLSLFLLAAVGVSEVARSVATLLAKDPERPGALSTSVGAGVCALFAVIFIGVPLGILPGTTYPTSGGVSFLSVFHRTYRNDIPGWAKWNFEGLEAKQPNVGEGGNAPDGQGGWPEFRAMVDAMDQLGKDPDHGCGRAFWEYGKRLESYGTPMAPMMIPYFTQGCIGSMEGLYFESSTTTPFHFITQCMASEAGSCAQRDLAYIRDLNLDIGIQQLELLGVKYYMAFTPEAVTAANASDRLTEVKVAGPWHIYQLDEKRSALVTPLENEPVVMDNVEGTQGSWLDPAVAWYLDPERWDVMFANSGPEEWERVSISEDPIEIPAAPAFVTIAEAQQANLGQGSGARAPGSRREIGARSLPEITPKPVTPAVVSNVVEGDESISFSVDRVGSPVLVKTSYFPNWKASGAQGPYRVAPNLMVVVPTSENVKLTYGRTGVDYLAVFMTLLGIGGLIGMTRLPAIVMPEPKVRERRRRPVEAGDGPYPPGAQPYDPMAPPGPYAPGAFAPTEPTPGQQPAFTGSPPAAEGPGVLAGPGSLPFDQWLAGFTGTTAEVAGDDGRAADAALGSGEVEAGPGDAPEPLAPSDRVDTQAPTGEPGPVVEPDR